MDIRFGDEGHVIGWADTEQRQVLLQTNMDLLAGNPRILTRAVYPPKDLQLTSADQLERAADATAEGTSDCVDGEERLGAAAVARRL